MQAFFPLFFDFLNFLPLFVFFSSFLGGRGALFSVFRGREAVFSGWRDWVGERLGGVEEFREFGGGRFVFWFLSVLQRLRICIGWAMGLGDGWELGRLEAIQKPAEELAGIGEAEPEAKGQVDGKYGQANSIGGEVGIRARLIQKDKPGDWQQA